ncbi:MAG: SDR family oxidoreductase [Ruminococcaceae bacterium]|nr:SDR family oxidoreductase [Oscillospiraceae bacterium]
MHRVIAVTGGSSGIGKAIARLFAQKGCTVYELSRSGKDDSGVIHITADVTDEAALAAAFEKIAAEHDCIDVLVNCAGFGISGAIEFTDIADAQRQMDVNFFGTVRATQQALPYLRKSGRASIVNISSMGAPLALPFQAFYSCSKSAINALTLALANELRQFGIAVSAVMPGDVVTGFTDAREKSVAGNELYGSTIEKSVSTMEKDERGGMSPDRIAKKVWSLSKKKHPKPLSTVGLQYKFFAFLHKALPARLVNWIVGKIYT